MSHKRMTERGKNLLDGCSTLEILRCDLRTIQSYGANSCRVCKKCLEKKDQN